MRRLADLYASTWDEPPHTMERIGLTAGSNRQYYRLQGTKRSVIGVIGTSTEENDTFIYLSQHFAKQQLPVPTIYAVSSDRLCYIQQDLGTRSLYDALHDGREHGGNYSIEEVALIRKVLLALPEIQFRGAKGLDFARCYPQSVFDEQSVLFDIHYFKYCFLKATGIEFNEYRLEEEAHQLAQDLTSECLTAFMYRDFQARNVLLDDSNNPHFIDYQGGRKGPCYYDVASFLWQATAHYSVALRASLIDEYYSALARYDVVRPAKDVFTSRLRLFVLFRLLQVLGAYGFRGYFEHKPHFVKSIIPAVSNLRQLLAETTFSYPYLTLLLQQICALPQYALPQRDDDSGGRLVVDIWSFAYKYGIPTDRTGHGGGYVFDCRSTHNPGRYDRYKALTGLDEPVIRFLEENGEILSFLNNVYNLIDHHVARYVQRRFTHLFIAFGCTGGQHRSVYCAEQLARHLLEKYDVSVVVHHREIGVEKTLCATR